MIPYSQRATIRPNELTTGETIERERFGETFPLQTSFCGSFDDLTETHNKDKRSKKKKWVDKPLPVNRHLNEQANCARIEGMTRLF
jgi:hypothetical protein